MPVFSIRGTFSIRRKGLLYTNFGKRSLSFLGVNIPRPCQLCKLVLMIWPNSGNLKPVNMGGSFKPISDNLNIYIYI